MITTRKFQIAWVLFLLGLRPTVAGAQQLTLELKDYVTMPMTPTPEVAKDILAKLQKFSDRFGTKFVIENNVAVIHVPPTAPRATNNN